MVGGQQHLALVAPGSPAVGLTIRKPNSPEYVLFERSVIAMA
jgi:hypothetical protein